MNTFGAVIEVMQGGGTGRAASLWHEEGAGLARWFAPQERTALASRRNRDVASAARIAAKVALRRALRRAGIAPPAPSDCLLAVADNGQPRFELPPDCRDRLVARGFSIGVSMSHATHRASAWVVLG